MADYKITRVTDDGFMTIEWDTGEVVTYPIPTDDFTGFPLVGAALNAWAGGDPLADIALRAAVTPRLTALKALVDQTRTTT